MPPNNLLAIIGREKKQTKKKKGKENRVFTCTERSPGGVAAKGEFLVHLLKLSFSSGLSGHPSSELSGKPRSMALLFSFAVFPQ